MINFDFSNKIVFITGAASGIGAAQTNAFLNAGARVFAFDQQERDLSELQKSYPEHFSYFLGDVRNKKACKKR